jgi:hypothetical protein
MPVVSKKQSEEHADTLIRTDIIAWRFHSSPHSQDTNLVQADIALTLSCEVKLLFFVVFVFCHGGIIGDGGGAGGISPRYLIIKP